MIRKINKRAKIAKENFQAGQTFTIKLTAGIIEEMNENSEYEFEDDLEAVKGQSFQGSIDEIDEEYGDIGFSVNVNGQQFDCYVNGDWFTEMTESGTIAIEKRSRRAKVAKEMVEIVENDKVVGFDAEIDPAKQTHFDITGKTAEKFDSFEQVADAINKLGFEVTFVLKHDDGYKVAVNGADKDAKSILKSIATERRALKNRKRAKIAKEHCSDEKRQSTKEVENGVEVLYSADFTQADVPGYDQMLDANRAIIEWFDNGTLKISALSELLADAIYDNMCLLYEKNKKSINLQASENYKTGQKFTMILDDSYADVEPDWEGKPVQGEITSIDGEYINFKFILPDGDVEYNQWEEDWFNEAIAEGTVSMEKRKSIRRAKIAKESSKTFKKDDKVQVTINKDKVKAAYNELTAELYSMLDTIDFVAEITHVDYDDETGETAYRVDLISTLDGEKMPDYLPVEFIVEPKVVSAIESKRISKESAKIDLSKLSKEEQQEIRDYLFDNDIEFEKSGDVIEIDSYVSEDEFLSKFIATEKKSKTIATENGILIDLDDLKPEEATILKEALDEMELEYTEDDNLIVIKDLDEETHKAILKLTSNVVANETRKTANSLAKAYEKLQKLENSKFAGIAAIEQVPPIYKHKWSTLTKAGKELVALRAKEVPATESAILNFWANLDVVAVERALVVANSKVIVAKETKAVENVKDTQSKLAFLNRSKQFKK